MAKQNPMAETPATERENAHDTVKPVAPTNWVMPRQKQLERHGDQSSPTTVFFPQVRGGVCEYCGVLDGAYPSEYQYKLCPHYRGMQLRCTYCSATKNQDEVINHTVLRVAEHPDNPDKLVVWCDSYECSKKHTERFKVSV